MENTKPPAEQATPQEAERKPSTLLIGGIIAAGLLFFFGVVPGALMAMTPHPHGTLYDDPQPAPDFELPQAGGGTFRLSDQKGKVVVLYFGYTSCPDVCPTTLLDLSSTMEDLGDDAEDVEVVFVTIDPEVDTSERIREYLNYFDESFIGLYGNEDELARVRDAYDVTVYRSDEGEAVPGYGITHTTAMFVIDREGLLKMRMHHDTDVEYLVRDLRYFVRGRL
jgi:protein SCO1/2